VSITYSEIGVELTALRITPNHRKTAALENRYDAHIVNFTVRGRITKCSAVLTGDVIFEGGGSLTFSLKAMTYPHRREIPVEGFTS
jgi:hypothetical protein